MSERKQRKWSKEARERLSQKYKDKIAADTAPLPSKVREEAVERTSEEELMTIDKYISKRDFGYDEGINFEMGQIVQPRGLPNDEKLIRLGYLQPYIADGTESSCLKCGKVFGSTSGYSRHVASHYEMCSICGKKVSPDLRQRHNEAHSVLA